VGKYINKNPLKTKLPSRDFIGIKFNITTELHHFSKTIFSTARKSPLYITVKYMPAAICFPNVLVPFQITL
jgi:hypothetical protein